MSSVHVFSRYLQAMRILLSLCPLPQSISPSPAGLKPPFSKGLDSWTFKGCDLELSRSDAGVARIPAEGIFLNPLVGSWKPKFLSWNFAPPSSKRYRLPREVREG